MGEGIKLSTVEDALVAGAWESTADLAIRALQQGDWSPGEEATLSHALARSFSNLNRYTEAIGPSERAVTLAEQAGEWDLVGLSLLELAWIQSHISGLQSQALPTIDRYFTHFSRYKGEAKGRYLLAQFSRGNYLLWAGRYPEALQQFLKTRNEAAVRHESAWADTARRNAAGVALILEELEQAADLIRQGEDYVSKHGDEPATVAGHLIDYARLCLLQGDIPGAKAKATEAAERARSLPAYAAQAYDILSQAAQASRDDFAALSAAVVGKYWAEEDQRLDLVSRFSGLIQEIALRNPGAVEEFASKLGRN